MRAELHGDAEEVPGVGRERGATILESSHAGRRPDGERAMADDDNEAFRDAMRGVRPLPRRANRPAAPRPRAAARFARAETSAVLRDSLAPPADASMLESGDALEFARPGISRDVLRKLRRGQFAVQAEIDLHGLGREAAHHALREFVADAVTSGLRACA